MMEITDKIEVKLIEKWREMLEKQQLRAPVGLTRSFSMPSETDSEEQLNVSIGVRVVQTTRERTEQQLRVDSEVARRALGGKEK